MGSTYYSLHYHVVFSTTERRKTLLRMLHRDGNPTARNLGAIVKSIAEDLGIRPSIEVTSSR
jgi:REP element-mobilizing transposase RayT